MGYYSILYGDQLDVFGLGSITRTTPPATPTTGAVELFELSLDSEDDLNDLQASEFTLATLTFDTLGAGISPLDMTIKSLGDAGGVSITPYAVGTGSVRVTANAVPEPSVLFLLTASLAAFAYFARKGNSAKQEARNNTLLR